MMDRLTQLQDAVDQVRQSFGFLRSAANHLQLANQFVASLFYVHKHHDYATLGPNDAVRQEAKSEADSAGKEQDGISPSTLYNLQNS